MSERKLKTCQKCGRNVYFINYMMYKDGTTSCAMCNDCWHKFLRSANKKKNHQSKN